MAGTKLGGVKTRNTLLAEDPNYYKRIGKIGGAAHNKGGFNAVPGLAQRAGSVGGKKRQGIKKCKNCLEQTHDNVNGFCATCQPQDTPELRALLGIDANGRKLQPRVTKTKSQALSVSSKSTSSKTKPGKKPSLKQSAEQSKAVSELRTVPPVYLSTEEWLTPPARERRIPVVSFIVDRYRVWKFDRWMDKNMDREAEIEISNFGNRPSKGGHGEV